MNRIKIAWILSNVLAGIVAILVLVWPFLTVMYYLGPDVYNSFMREGDSSAVAIIFASCGLLIGLAVFVLLNSWFRRRLVVGAFWRTAGLMYFSPMAIYVLLDLTNLR